MKRWNKQIFSYAIVLSITILILITNIAIAEQSQTVFSAEKGERFYHEIHKTADGESMGCFSCHGKDPTQKGMTRANKVIEPMAHSRNPTRFTDPAKVEKWFRRNCKDVLARECTQVEKGHFLAYLNSK